MARTMTPAETLRAYCAAFARHEGDAIEALFAPDAILDLPLYDRRLNGRDEIIHELRTALRGIKDITVTLDHVVESGDRAFAEGIFTGETINTPSMLAVEDCIAALEWALRLATALGRRLVVVHAVGLLEEGGYRERPDVVAIVGTARQRVAGTEDDRIAVIVEDGPAAEVVVRVAEREVAGLIVVGSRGVGQATRLLGSVSEAVLAHAHCPALIVPRPRDPTHHDAATDGGPLRFFGGPALNGG